MEVWKHLSKYTQGLILIMVSILFFVWGVFGSATVNNQNANILEGVHRAVDQNFTAIQDNQATLLASTRFVVCILNIPPDHRNPKKIQRCRREAGLHVRGTP